MLAPRNSGRALVNVAVVLVVLAVAAWVVLRETQATARVKPVGRDTAVDAVTGTVTVSAEGGYKEVKSDAEGKVVQAQAIAKTARFKAGETLVQLDTSDLDRQRAELVRNFKASQERLELQLKDDPRETAAKELFDNATRLEKLGRATGEQVKTAERALVTIRRELELGKFDSKKLEDDYQARLKDLQILKDKMSIPAPPVDGVVQMPLTWEGALIGRGTAVAVVYANTRVVAAKISEEKFGKVKIGQEANLRLLTYGSRTFNAKVAKLLPTADEAQRFEVWLEVDVDPELLLPGSTGEATITVDKRPNALVIPRRALFAGDKVWVVKDGRVKKRQVKVGFDSALNVVEILEGLEFGEQVILERLDEYYDGQRVRVEVVN